MKKKLGWSGPRCRGLQRPCRSAEGSVGGSGVCQRIRIFLAPAQYLPCDSRQALPTRLRSSPGRIFSAPLHLGSPSYLACALRVQVGGLPLKKRKCLLQQRSWAPVTHHELAEAARFALCLRPRCPGSWWKVGPREAAVGERCSGLSAAPNRQHAWLSYLTAWSLCPKLSGGP